MTLFEEAFAVVVATEGNYSDDATDPGGKTKFGITETVARANSYVGEMKDFPIAQAQTIYQEDYWDACKCDKLPWPLSLYVFDAAVNQGVQPAIKMLQRALDTVQDGVIGGQTLLLAGRSTKWHCNRFMAFRALRYMSTRNFDKYGEGWLNRLFTIAGK